MVARDVELKEEQNVRVLVVVEDEPDVRLIIKLHLRTDPRLKVAGEASDAASAIELARTEAPGLIILDHQIEGDIMGLDAAPLLKEAAPNAKILLFTAFDLRREATSSPFVDAFVSKRDFKDLLPVVRQLLDLEPI